VRRMTIAIILALATSLSAGTSIQANAAWLYFTVSLDQSYSIWQTSPPAFERLTRWAGVGLSLDLPLIWGISFDVATTIIDFQTFEIRYPPSFALSLSKTLARFLEASLSASTGVVITPAARWTAYWVGIGLTRPLVYGISASLGTGIEWTAGAPGGYPLGSIGMQVSESPGLGRYSEQETERRQS